MAQYNIPPRVSIRHCLQGEWQALRSGGEVVIPMIAFIEGGMRIPMGRVTRDFLITYRLCPTQCSQNLFRILGSVDALNDKMGVNLTHHDVNWVYNCQHLKSMGYYLKTRVPEVRLISCLPNLVRTWAKIFGLSRVSGMMIFIVRHEKGNQVGYFRLRLLVLTLNTLIS